MAAMSAPAPDVDEIVRSVLARLGTGQPTGAGSNVPAGPAGAPPAAPASKKLRIAGRVVSLADLPGGLDGASAVVVDAAAVVTPSVRDLLRHRGMGLEFAPRSAAPAPRLPLVVGVAEARFSPDTLVHALDRRGVQVERVASTGLAGVVTELADLAARGGKLGLCITGRPAAAVCLANRHRGTRAVTETGPARVEAAVREAGANLLVLDPERWGLGDLHRAVIGFARGAPYGCPDELRTPPA
jgi:hypothetical protein